MFQGDFSTSSIINLLDGKRWMRTTRIRIITFVIVNVVIVVIGGVAAACSLSSFFLADVLAVNHPIMVPLIEEGQFMMLQKT